MAKMTKSQLSKFERILADIAKTNGSDVEELKQDVDIASLYTTEVSMYEGQSVLNFFEARIQPRIEKGEKAEIFDKRYREWRIKLCGSCGEEFAYALDYDGVKYCSLECLDAALAKIGLKVTRGRDLRKRWGVHHHPAIVPSSAFRALKEIYGQEHGDAFDPKVTTLPKPQSQSLEPK